MLRILNTSCPITFTIKIIIPIIGWMQLIFLKSPGTLWLIYKWINYSWRYSFILFRICMNIMKWEKFVPDNRVFLGLFQALILFEGIGENNILLFDEILLLYHHIHLTLPHNKIFRDGYLLLFFYFIFLISFTFKNYLRILI